MQKVELSLPLPPSVNQYWRHPVLPVKGSKKFRVAHIVSEDGRNYRETVRRLIFDAIPDLPPLPLRQELRVECRYFYPDRRRRDTSNFSKALFDALTYAKFWDDDYQVWFESHERMATILPGAGRVLMEISTYAI
jgi:crossover junction endodeoxyribonuclease RusA